MNASWQRLKGRFEAGVLRSLPRASLQALVVRLAEEDPQMLVEALGPRLNRTPTLETMPFDVPIHGPLQFEHLAGLFASTSLDHAVISMTVRQAAYVFGLVRQMNARKIIEIGRYKGGSTLLLAAAMGPEGTLWSIDLGEKLERLDGAASARSVDAQLAHLCEQFGLRVHSIVGDSRTVGIETGPVDVVFIDGDHSVEGVASDVERFGTRVRLGGAVLFDDAFDEALCKTHSATVGKVVRAIVDQGEFRLVKVVNRLAHLERVRHA